MARMIGSTCPAGPGGRDCYCCGQAPKHRKVTKRAAKRSERHNWKREAMA